MEFHFLFFFLISFFCSCFFLRQLWKVIGNRREEINPGKKVKLPPGPFRLPVIGNIHNLISSHPHHKLRDLASRYGPLMQMQLGDVPAIVVSSAQVAKEIMKTQDKVFAHRPPLVVGNRLFYDSSDIIFSPYSGYWRQLRLICMRELLTAKRVFSFRPIREDEAEALVRRVSSKEGSAINISKMIFSMTYSLVLKAAVGGERKCQEELASVIAEAAKLSSGFYLADMYPSNILLRAINGFGQRVETLFAKSDKILQEIIDDHKSKRKWEAGLTQDEREREDLVDVLFRHQHRGDLEYAITDDNIKAIILDILAAGSETSSITVEWAFSELLRNRELMQRAQNELREVFDQTGKVEETGIDELKFLKRVVKETLRLHPPAPLLVPRESNEDCTIKGYSVRSKTRVIVNAWAIQRDPAQWKDPEKFNPDRFLECCADLKGTDFSFMPFGSGRRICPGILFAMPDIELPLAKLLYHFDWKQGDGKELEALDMSEGIGITVRRKRDLILVPVIQRPLH